MKTGDTFTSDQAQAFTDCAVEVHGQWRDGYKFAQRARHTALVLCSYGNMWIAVRYNCMSVRVGGAVLPYIGRYTYFNPKKPFPPSTETS